MNVTIDTELYRADAPLRWGCVQQFLPRPSLQWCDWLLDPGSLTRRLQALSNGDFHVQVLDERWMRGNPAHLGIFAERYRSRMMWSRRVLLCGGGEPWVAAHSLIPVDSLRGELRQLVKLRDRPLGGFLFKYPQLRRQLPQVAPLAGHWGRRSMFYLREKPVLVAEFYLPALMRAAGSLNAPLAGNCHD